MLGRASGSGALPRPGGGMERRWVFVLLDVLCVLVGKSRGDRAWGGTPSQAAPGGLQPPPVRGALGVG